jgi:hypothetical protein
VHPEAELSFRVYLDLIYKLITLAVGILVIMYAMAHGGMCYRI